ncbi:hypothetical protein O181_041608 [Austropuccinia psidii MF-1]|uniref:Reverse transcriptase RNase H-like domain-containing protein n=1 Tax=Austropuccinia psidii MF-1 TaxID=1389203 RepID=A0A9Q3HDY7_9BASI|nr:hypothetical protein [Austropuccinia psidii MF-1]
MRNLSDSFINLKELSPLLQSSLLTIVETDSSHSALGAVPSQVTDSGKHPIAFYSHKLLPEELNYEIDDKELLGIVWALKRWRDFLLSLSSPFKFLTNHSSLKYFTSSKLLTLCQGFWAEFHFSITYLCGHLTTLPDALSCWDNVYPDRGENSISKNPINYQKIIKKNEIEASKSFAVKVDSFSNLIDLIQKALWKDAQYRSILQDMGRGRPVQDYSIDSSSQLLLYKDWVVVPNYPTIHLSILQKQNDSLLAAHPAKRRLSKLSRRIFTGLE